MANQVLSKNGKSGTNDPKKVNQVLSSSGQSSLYQKWPIMSRTMPAVNLGKTVAKEYF